MYSVLQEQGKLGKDFVPLYAACLISALSELHSQKWMYRDLKVPARPSTDYSAALLPCCPTPLRNPR